MTKECSGCNEVKTLEEFRISTKRADGRENTCKPCGNKRQAAYRVRTGRNKQIRIKDRFVNMNERKFFSKYGLYNRDVFKMFKEQKGLCKICNGSTSSKRNNGNGYLSVDHCHVTGKVRGLLCTSCNLGLGFLDDDVETMKNAIKYLQ